MDTRPDPVPAIAPPGDLAIWFFILAELLAFGVFFGAYAFGRAHNVALFNEMQQHLDRQAGAVNTVLLITGSWCVARAVEAVERSRAATGARWLAAELWDHLWPWAGRGQPARKAIQGAGFALAIAATVAWVLAAMGRLEAGAIIGWWFGWSVYEVLIRLSGRRYVKDGVWWRGNYRAASVMDMMSYVGFKNLLIGAALFLALKTLGLLIL